MPKPVLSDSLFNADDVATAVLAEANLQIANSDLGVVDRAGLFSYGTGFLNNNHPIRAYSLIGFMFVNIHCYLPNATPSNNAVVITCSDSNFYSTATQSAVTLGYELDSGYSLNILTNGNITIEVPTNRGGSNFLVVANFFYRYA